MCSLAGGERNDPARREEGTGGKRASVKDTKQRGRMASVEIGPERSGILLEISQYEICRPAPPTPRAHRPARGSSAQAPFPPPPSAFFSPLALGTPWSLLGLPLFAQRLSTTDETSTSRRAWQASSPPPCLAGGEIGGKESEEKGRREMKEGRGGREGRERGEGGRGEGAQRGVRNHKQTAPRKE
jgi:hypothetical protein